MPRADRRPGERGPVAHLERWGRAIQLAIFFPVVMLSIAGLAAPHLHPGPFWWAAIAAILLPAILVLVFGGIVFTVLSRQWVLAGLGTAVLIVGMARLMPFERLGGQPQIADDDLVVMTFSVPRFGETVEGLASNVFDLLDRESPDLVALQETVAWRRPDRAGDPRIADYMEPALDSLDYRLAIPARLEERRTPLPILTRNPDGPRITDQREGRLAEHPRAGRYVRSRFEWQGREAVLYNVHLRGYGSDKPWEEDAFPLLRPRDWLPFVRRYREAFRQRAIEVGALRERLDREVLPVIIAGDFNVTPRNWDYRQLARGRTDAFRAAGSGWGKTYRGDLPLVRIDYILVGPEFAVTGAHVPATTFSDHRPVVARLRWLDPGPHAPTRR